MFAKEAMVLLPEEFYHSHCADFQIKYALNKVADKLIKLGIEMHTMNLFYHIKLLDNPARIFDVFNQCDHFIMSDQGYEIIGKGDEPAELKKIKSETLKRIPYDPKLNHLEGMFYAAKKRVKRNATSFTKRYKCVLDFQSVKEKLISITPKSIKDDCLYVKFDSFKKEIQIYYNNQQLSSSDIFGENSPHPLKWK